LKWFGNIYNNFIYYELEKSPVTREEEFMFLSNTMTKYLVFHKLLDTTQTIKVTNIDGLTDIERPEWITDDMLAEALLCL
jgi:hypothetical protein